MPLLRLALHALLLALGMGLLAYALQFGQPHTVKEWPTLTDGWLSFPPPASEPVARAFLFLAFAALAAAYLSALRAARRVGPSRGVLAMIIGAAILLSLLSAVNTIALSTDVYSYILYGRMTTEYGLNPMVVAPTAVANDPFFSLVPAHYQGSVSVYGPYWAVLSALVTPVVEALGGGEAIYIAAYRIIATAALVLAIWAIWRILGRRAPDYQVTGTLIFAWCPLVLVETSALHNDVLMVALVLAGVWLLTIDRPYLALALMIVAVLVKWIAVVPMLIVMTAWLSSLPAQQRLGSAAKAAGVGALVVLPPLLFFGQPLKTLLSPFSDAGDGLRNTISELLLVLLTRLAPGMAEADLSHGVQLLSRAAVAATVVVALVLAWRRPQLRWALTVSTAALLILLIVAPRFWPWYALWPLALAPFAARPLRWATITLALTAPLTYVLYPSKDDPALWETGRSLAVFLPALIVLVGVWLRERSQEHRPDPGAWTSQRADAREVAAPLSAEAA